MRRMVVLAMIVAAFAVTAMFYPRLPEQVPTHFNAEMQPDRWGPRASVFVLPGIMLAVLALFEVLPRISPRGWKLDPKTRAYAAMQIMTIGVMLVVQLLVLASTLGRDVGGPFAITFAVGVTFAVIGNYMGKVTRNFFVGIRTPWTLASDEVWYQTHRLGGKMFVAAGLVLMALSPFLRGPVLLTAMVTVALVAAIVPAVYSYVVWRRIDGAARRE